jgi:hypothetical protein
MSATQQHSNIPSTAVVVASGLWRTSLHVGGVLEAGHSCMTLRGVRPQGAKTVTSALLGTLRADPQPGGVLRAGWRTALSTSCPFGQEGSRHG